MTNGNGSDTYSVNIIVNGLTGCDTITNTIPSDNNFTWTWGAPNGYIGGHNFIEQEMIAEKYSGLGPTNLMGAQFYFTEGETNNPNAFITIMVWEANVAGEPGNVVYTEDLLIDVIEDNVTGPGAGSFFITDVDFDLPVSVSTSDFFVGYELNYAAGDTVNCAMTDDLSGNAARPNTMWYYVNPANNPAGVATGWVETGGDVSTTAEWSMHIYPRITQTPPTAVVTATPNPVCQGDFVTFDGTTSPNAVNWEWAINGTTTPFPTGGSPQVVMNSAGSPWAYMAAYNSCGFSHVDSVQITVNPTPVLNVVATSDTICPGNSATFTVSGGSSYVWSPGASLSCTSCAGPVATPSTTTTYTVTGTTGACSSVSNYTIIVDDSQPVASFLSSNDTICEGDAVTYNGAISSSASSFAWTFTGGSISSSGSSNPTVVYSTAGTYTVDLTVQNTCSQTDNTSGQIVVIPASDAACAVGLGNDLSSQILIGYDNINHIINMDLSNSSVDGMAYVMSASGQLISKTSVTGGGFQRLNVSSLSNGLYMIIIEAEGQRMVQKFVR